MNKGVDITTLDPGAISEDVIHNEKTDVIAYCILMNLCTRDDIIDAAIKANKLKILKLLIEDDIDEMEYILIKAVEYNASEVMTYALNHLELTRELASNTLKWSTNNGNLEITKYLLKIIQEQGITFEKEELIGFINLTCKSGSRDMLQLVLNYCEKTKFSSNDLRFAMNWIITRDNLKLLKLFLQTTNFDRKMITASAIRSGKHNIINYMQQIGS